jgi:hypothetical protein
VPQPGFVVFAFGGIKVTAIAFMFDQLVHALMAPWRSAKSSPGGEAGDVVLGRTADGDMAPFSRARCRCTRWALVMAFPVMGFRPRLSNLAARPSRYVADFLYLSIETRMFHVSTMIGTSPQHQTRTTFPANPSSGNGSISSIASSAIRAGFGLGPAGHPQRLAPR